MVAPDEARARKDALVGTVVNGKYRVHQAIARGGMGRIYYATQEPLDRPVALKVVQADGENEDESQFLKRFLQEASILAKLQHPNVVTLFDYGRIEGSEVEKFFIAMEFLAGETLLHRLKTRGRLEIGETLILGRQMMRGLREAHKRGIVHRDLKPSNIILVPEGDGPEIVKLVDFGIGKVLGRSDDAHAQDLTQDGVFVGTPRYMAPEQFEGTASPASDLYALGTIMFQAITGQLPFSGSNMSEFMVAKLARDVPTMREIAPDLQIPDTVESLVMHLLARRPADRPSMEALHAHFMACDEEVFGTGHGRRRNSSGPHHHLSATGSGPYSMLKTGSGHLGAAPGTGSVRAITGPHGATSGEQHGAPISAPISSAQTTEQMIGPPAGALDESGERQIRTGTGDQDMRVPPTIVHAVPSMDLLRAQMTPRPMASSTRPQPPTSGARTAAFLAVGALVVMLLGATVYWKARMRTPAGSPEDAQGRESAQERADREARERAAAAASATATAPAAVGTAFFVTVTSVPPGATVLEGEKTLGTTPLTFSVERTSVASGPRTFRVEKKGFTPSQVVQGDETSLSKEWTISLTPDASTTVKSRPPIKPAGAATPAANPASTNGPGADIRPKR